MQFTKMHGLGNDYVFVDARAVHVAQPAQLARRVSNRHTGIGADGLILIHPGDQADARMETFNADGSRAQMCGNGIRCVAKYLVDRGLVKGPTLAIETDAGIHAVECRLNNETVTSVRVDMGCPATDPLALPCTIDAKRIVDHPLEIAGQTLSITCVSIGNPHAVVFDQNAHKLDLVTIGPALEHAPVFPQRINAHFVRVDAPTRVTVRTWERGSGATRACGTGACAVCVAGALTGRTERIICAELPGGELLIEWADDDHVYMTGPATEVFTGHWPE